MLAFSYSMQSNKENKKKTVKTYCETLIGKTFKGETSNQDDEQVRN